MSKITTKLSDLYDIVGWDDMGMLGDLVEEFEEEAIKYLRIEREFEKNNTDWQNENLDDMDNTLTANRDRGYHHFPHILTTCSLV